MINLPLKAVEHSCEKDFEVTPVFFRSRLTQKLPGASTKVMNTLKWTPHDHMMRHSTLWKLYSAAKKQGVLWVLEDMNRNCVSQKSCVTILIIPPPWRCGGGGPEVQETEPAAVLLAADLSVIRSFSGISLWLHERTDWYASVQRTPGPSDVCPIKDSLGRQVQVPPPKHKILSCQSFPI